MDSQEEGQQPDGADDEVCVNCGEQVGPIGAGSLGGRIKQAVHTWCSPTYKSLVRKRGKEKVFDAWWTKLTDEQQMLYYRDRGEVHLQKIKQSKRKWDAMNMHSHEGVRTSNRAKVMDRWAPFRCVQK